MTDHQRPRVRPWIRRLAMVAFPILLLVAAHSLWDYIEVRRVQGEIDAIRGRKEPASARRGVSQAWWKGGNAENQAGRFYQAAAMLAFPTDENLDGYSRLSPVRYWLAGQSERPNLAEIGSATKVVMARHEHTYGLLDAAATRQFNGFPPGTEYNYEAAGLSNLTRVVATRTIGLSLAGDGDAAVRSVLSGIRLRRVLGGTWLFRKVDPEIAAVLSLTRPSADALEELQRALLSEEQANAALNDLLVTRARMIDDFADRFFVYIPTGSVEVIRTRDTAPFADVLRPWAAHYFVRTLRAWAELIDVARTPWPQRAVGLRGSSRHAAIPFRPAGMLKFLLLRDETGQTLAYIRFREGVRPDQLIMDRSARIAVAIERFRRAHADALPNTLNDLVPTFLDAVPPDPLTGQPMRYHATPEAYMVYSTGPDGDDDGGMLLRETPVSNAERFARGADVGIRVLVRHP